MDETKSFKCKKCEHDMVRNGKLVFHKHIKVKRSDYPAKRQVYLHCFCGHVNKITEDSLKVYLYEAVINNENITIRIDSVKKPRIRRRGRKSSNDNYSQEKIKKEIRNADDSIKRWNKQFRSSARYRLPGSYGTKK